MDADAEEQEIACFNALEQERRNAEIGVIATAVVILLVFVTTLAVWYWKCRPSTPPAPAGSLGGPSILPFEELDRRGFSMYPRPQNTAPLRNRNTK